MSGVIHEFYYVVGCRDFHSWYRLIVDKETEKMLYGRVFDSASVDCGRFAVKKSNIDDIHEICDAKRGSVYRVQIDGSDFTSARNKAKDIIYKHLIKIAEKFKAYEEEV